MFPPISSYLPGDLGNNDDSPLQIEFCGLYLEFNIDKNDCIKVGLGIDPKPSVTCVIFIYCY